MTPSAPPEDFATLASRRVAADRSLVVHLAAEPGSTSASTGLSEIGAHIGGDVGAAERIAVTDPEECYRFLDNASAGEVLILECRVEAVPESAWGRLVTILANARYRGVHAIVIAPDVPTLVQRAVTVRVDPRGDAVTAALLEPAEQDPERSREIDLGPL